MAGGLGASLDTHMDSLDFLVSRGAMPGYSGHIPGMRNHVIGRRFAEATLRASDCSDLLRRGSNPSSLEGCVDARPQGRNFFYAQMHAGKEGAPCLADPHFGKRKPFINGAVTGEVDYRLMPKVIGGLGDHTLPAMKTVSISKLPYANRRFVTRKEYPEACISDTQADNGKVPGYTGHQPSAMHVYAKPYGQITSDLSHASTVPTDRAKQFINYGEVRPNGAWPTDANVDATRLAVPGRIPGYQGFIPGKDNHVYGRTYGDSAKLAVEANTLLRNGGNPSCDQHMAEFRPQGRVDLYAEAHMKSRHHSHHPLLLHMGKGMFQHTFQEKGADFKLRDKSHDQMNKVHEGRHQLAGYSGHVHGEQHMFGKSYGETTRKLHGVGATQTISDDLLYYADPRPNKG